MAIKIWTVQEIKNYKLSNPFHIQPWLDTQMISLKEHNEAPCSQAHAALIDYILKNSKSDCDPKVHLRIYEMAKKLKILEGTN